MHKTLDRWLYRLQAFLNSFRSMPFLVPYWKKEEWLECLRLLFQGKLVKGHAQEDLYQLLTERLGARAMLFTPQGRTALSLALHHLNIQEGDEILLPSFLCGSVARAVLGRGAVPVWVDIKEDFTMDPESLKKCISSKSKAVILVHAGGKVADISEISAIAERNELFVIDDAAQALGAVYKGRPVGTWGVCGILSFGQGKNAMATAGGVLVLNQQAERASLRSQLKQPEPWRKVFFRLLHRFFFHRLRRWTMPLALLKEFGEKSSSLWRMKDSCYLLSNLDAALASLQIQRLDEIILKRKQNSLFLKGLLEETSGLTFPEAEGHIFTKCWVTLTKDSPSTPGSWGVKTLALAKHLRRSGIEVEWPYVPLHLRLNIPGVTRHRLTQTESVWWRTLALPVQPHLKSRDMERMAACIKKFFEEKVEK